MIGTNTLAQGDTRDVSLRAAQARGRTSGPPIKSEDWPTSGAVLEYCVVWISWKAGPLVCEQDLMASVFPESRLDSTPQGVSVGPSFEVAGQRQ